MVCALEEVLKKPIIQEENPNWSVEEFGKILKEVIENYVNECFSLNQGVIYTTLSGGIDSSLCLAIIRETLGNSVEIHTFTVGGYSQHPDLVFARMVAEQFETNHHELIPSRQMIGEASRELKMVFPRISEKEIQENLGVYFAYDLISQKVPEFSIVIAHDGIDELLGGYWKHRASDDLAKKKVAFNDFWEKLRPEHIDPLMQIASSMGLGVAFPYLDSRVVEYISRIPVQERTSHEISKIPLRKIASKYLPKEIIKRQKLGFCDAISREVHQ
jgi:asparagine synthase (glutamine-hydrolysing)